MKSSFCAFFVFVALTLFFSGPALATPEWTAIINKAETTLNAKSEVLAQLEKELPAEIEELRKNRVSLTASMELMLWSRETDYNNPLDLNDVIRALNDFISNIDELVEPYKETESSLELHARELEAQLKRLKNSESWMQELVPPDEVVKVNAMLHKATRLAERINALRATLQDSLQNITLFEERLRKLQSFYESRYIPALHEFYVEPSPAALTSRGRASTITVTKHWLTGLGFSSMESHATNIVDWIILIALSLGAALVIMRFIQWGVNTLDRAEKPFFGKKAATHAGAWAGSGLALLAAVSTMQISPSSFFRALAVIFLARGMLLLAGSLKKNDDARCQKLLFLNAWRVFAVGNILQGLLMPEEALSIIMTVVLAGGGLAYVARVKKESGLEKLFCLAVAWPWLGLAVLSLFGWGNLAVDAADFLFALYLNLLVGIRMMTTLNVTGQKDKDTSSIARGIFLAFSFPLLLITFAVLILIMTLAPLGGFSLLRVLLDMEFGYGGSSFTIARLVSIVGLFFVTQSIVAFMCDVIIGRKGRNNVPPGAVSSLQTLTSYAVWAAYILIALYLAGIPIDSLSMVAGGLSVGIGFGMKNIVNNFFSGLILLFGRSVQPGDVVDAGAEMGRVDKVTIRNTVLTTYSGKTVFVPNSELVSKTFMNWSYKDPKFRMSLTLNIACDSDVEMVTGLLLKIMDKHPDVLKKPLPQVRFQNFDDSSLEFEIRFWIPNDGALYVSSELRYAINKEFQEHGIEMPFPQQDIHIRRASGK